jgi:molecular chaperone GrpE
MEEERLDRLIGEVADLKDLFLRRLMDDKVKTAVIAQLKENNAALQKMLDEKAVLNLVKDILIVCDRIDAQPEVDDLTASVEDELLEILARRDFFRMEVKEYFDPALHNAVGTVPATDGVQDKTIIKVVRNGYMFRERVIRPADVIVAVKKRD